MLVTLDQAKEFLRIDGQDEDETISSMLGAAKNLCMDVTRLDEATFDAAGDIAQSAVLYALAYLYEHREDANYHALTHALRSLLFGIRREVF